MDLNNSDGLQQSMKLFWGWLRWSGTPKIISEIDGNHLRTKNFRNVIQKCIQKQPQPQCLAWTPLLSAKGRRPRFNRKVFLKSFHKEPNRKKHWTMWNIKGNIEHLWNYFDRVWPRHLLSKYFLIFHVHLEFDPGCFDGMVAWWSSKTSRRPK